MQNKTQHFEGLCACSMAHGHKFVKLNPPKLAAMHYVMLIVL